MSSVFDREYEKLMSRGKRKPFSIKVLERISKPPTNEALIAQDLRVTVPSVRRAVDHHIKYGRVERYEVPGYPPELVLTKDGIQLLREQVPGWWKRRS